MPNKTLLDPVVIAQISNLQLRARRLLDALYSGHHTNLSYGQSQNFSEHRPYNPGDELKRIDWKVFGRTDRLVIRQYQEQSNVGAVVILDDSASMNYASEGRLSKLDYAKTLAAAMGYLVMSQHDAIGLALQSHYLPPLASRGHLHQFFNCLESIKGQGIWDIDLLTASLTAPIKKRSFLLIFSDLLEEPQKVIKALRALSAKKHEVLVFHIFDPAERDLPFEGPVIVQDMETGGVLKTDATALRATYQQIVKERVAHLSQAFQGAGVDYLFLTTDTPFDRGLGAYLSWRGARL